LVFVRLDSPEGQAILAQSKAKAMEIANRIAQTKGLSMEVHEITSGFLGNTTSAPGYVNQLDGAHLITLAQSCAIVFCGFVNAIASFSLGSTAGATLRIAKGREFLTDLDIYPINNFAQDKRGVDSGFTTWGIWQEGEDLSWAFLNASGQTGTYLSVWPIGYVIIPEGKSQIY